MVYWYKGKPSGKNIYSVNIGSDKIKRLSPDNGTHNGYISYSGKYILDVFSNTEVSREYALLNSKGKKLRGY